jgi:hypothetical protein
MTGNSNAAAIGPGIRKGDIVAFGSFRGSPIKWRTLAVDEAAGRALLITEECIAKRGFHMPGNHNIWEKSTIRTWLNEDFLAALDDADKSRIVDAEIPVPDKRDSENGAVTDKVFLLSYNEAASLFPDDASRVAKIDGDTVFWWLRSPGSHRVDASGVFNDGDILGNAGNVNDDGGGIRPAIYVTL